MDRIAVIDIGTVTSRFAVADVEDGRVARLAKRSTITNLGEGVAESGRLCSGAMGRVSTCVAGYLDAAREAGAEVTCTTLTSAARDAENSEGLLAALEKLGAKPQVIPGEVEGSLTFLGVAQDFPGERVLVADNGGGSTELALGTLGAAGLDLAFVRSVDVGCRRVTERFLAAGDPPSPGDIGAARGFCRDSFVPAVAAMRTACGDGDDTSGNDLRLVAVGGTVTSLVAMRETLAVYDSAKVHLSHLALADVDRVAADLAQLTVEERRHIVGLQPDRAPVILGGALAISELLGTLGLDGLTVSESDLLFGMALTCDAALRGAASPVGWAPELACL